MSEIELLRKELKGMGREYAKIRTLEESERRVFGEKLNLKKREILTRIAELEAKEESESLEPIDLTAPANVNQSIKYFRSGSRHPLTVELEKVVDIYARMGFDIMEARQLDDEYHMFESLNFPEGHPARDGYDTFRTKEGFMPPAHTSVMQNRALIKYREKLEKTGQLAVAIPGRVFRNEDVDATHEHTFYQCEGVFVSKDATVGQMLGVLENFLEVYYGQKLEVKTQPGYFPFTEPSVEILIKKPEGMLGKGDGWLEMLGCGMIHPNVLKEAGISPEVYRGFAFGGGIERLVMLKYGINDIRYFESGKLEFLEEF